MEGTSTIIIVWQNAFYLDFFFNFNFVVEQNDDATMCDIYTYICMRMVE